MNNDEYKKLQQKEVDDNFIAFEKMLKSGEIPSEHDDKFALMKGGEIKGYYSTWNDAHESGLLAFTDRLFSIQEVSNEVIDLGFYSHAFIQR